MDACSSAACAWSLPKIGSSAFIGTLSFFRLRQDGDDALFEVDNNGSGDGFIALVRFDGVDVDASRRRIFRPAMTGTSRSRTKLRAAGASCGGHPDLSAGSRCRQARPLAQRLELLPRDVGVDLAVARERAESAIRARHDAVMAHDCAVAREALRDQLFVFDIVRAGVDQSGRQHLVVSAAAPGRNRRRARTPAGP